MSLCSFCVSTLQQVACFQPVTGPVVLIFTLCERPMCQQCLGSLELGGHERSWLFLPELNPAVSACTLCERPIQVNMPWVWSLLVSQIAPGKFLPRPAPALGACCFQTMATLERLLPWSPNQGLFSVSTDWNRLSNAIRQCYYRLPSATICQPFLA